MRRLHPQENANAVAAEQIAAFLPHVRAADPLPWFLFDAGYDPVQLTPALGETPVAILVRLRAGRCFYTDPNGPERTRLPSPTPAGRGGTATSSLVTTRRLSRLGPTS